jgi:hypothetical protein
MNIYTRSGALLPGLLFTVQALAEASPEAALDTLHRAGAEANQADFIAVLAPSVVFLGVGDGTRLQGQALRDFVSESFASGNTWDYRTNERDVRLSADGSVAWFDESLEHDQLGRGRGSGVLTQNGGAWKVVQYDLTVPLPGAVVVSEAETPAAVAPAVSKKPQKPQCRKVRHKTNKQASC